MRQLRDDTHLLCVTKTVSPAMFGTLCFWFLVQTLRYAQLVITLWKNRVINPAAGEYCTRLFWPDNIRRIAPH